MPKLSIIIPVYNSEKYLTRCLNSVINQSYKNIEIIIINDASTDNSQNIINTYKEKDARIISLINKKNRSHAFSRNTGLDISTGDFITFVDSDDWIENNMYEEMMEVLIKNNADIIECNAKIIQNNSTNLFIKSLKADFKKNNIQIDKYILNLYKNKMCNALWNKIYKTEIIKNNNIKFKNDKIMMSTDLLFNLEAIPHSKNIVTIDKPFYNYVIRQGSVSHKNDTVTIEKINNFIESYYKNNNNYSKKSFFNFSIILIPFIKTYILNKIIGHKKPIKSGTIVFRELIKDKMSHQIIKNCIKNNNAFYKDRIFCLLIILRMYYINLFWILIFKKQ